MPVVTPSSANRSNDRSKGSAGPLVAFLLRPRTHGESAGRVECVETHISWVFLTDRHAYKLKKPVAFDFLDFSTPEKRRQACEDEVRLNRRLAADVYLGVVPVTLDARGRPRLGGSGKPVDYLVHMRRLPAEAALDRRIRNGQLADHDVDRLAEWLAGQYVDLPPLAIDTSAYRKGIEKHVRENRRSLASLAASEPTVVSPAVVQRVHAAQIRLLRLAPELLDRRVCDGRIVEGHGDLRPEHVYFLPAPVAIDGIEFSRELRSLDVLDELAFLAMECEHLGAPAVGRRVIDAYLLGSGDNPPAALLSFYKCYRACVRAKVQGLRSEQLPAEERSGSLGAAAQYLELAARYAEDLGPPPLLVVRGLSGTGKSTLASALAESLGLEHLQTDAVRRELLGPPAESSGYAEGRYRPEEREKIYAEVFRRADASLAARVPLVLDGAFLGGRWLEESERLAARHGATLLVVRCVCPDNVARQRMADRGHHAGALSEARPEFLELQRLEQETCPPRIEECTIDTTESLPAMLEAVYGRLRAKFGPSNWHRKCEVRNGEVRNGETSRGMDSGRPRP
jgi:aminoglycoside phosphotransferase family enzyme/predicted kinase